MKPTLEANRIAVTKWRISHPEEHNWQNRTDSRHVKMEVFLSYGGNCSCCGEWRYELLSIDHINGRGKGEDKDLRRGEDLYRWLRRNDYPEGYRVLCHNCNLSFGLFGYCPHQSEVGYASN